jgi:hypothetical protein
LEFFRICRGEWRYIRRSIWQKIWTITFSTLLISRMSYFFKKMSMWFLDFLIRIEFSLCFGVEKCVFLAIMILQSELKNRGRSMIFSVYRKRTPLSTLVEGKKSSDYIIRTVSAQNTGLFVTWIVSLRTILIFITSIILF